MVFDIQAIHDFISDFQALLLYLVYQEGLNLQAALVRSTPKEGQHRLEGTQWDSSPIDADRLEQTVVNRVPYRCAGGIVTYRHFQPQAIRGMLLKLLIPQSGTIAVAAACISQDQELITKFSKN
jgi:hypothetical protein